MLAIDGTPDGATVACMPPRVPWWCSERSTLGATLGRTVPLSNTKLSDFVAKLVKPSDCYFHPHLGALGRDLHQRREGAEDQQFGILIVK